jgi:phage regulator Rha-like protein
MKIKKFEELNESVNIKQRVNEINTMFDSYIKKLTILQKGYGLKSDEQDKIVHDLMEFMVIIKSQYVEQWEEVEGTTIVINNLEEKIIELGGDLKKIKKEIGIELVKNGFEKK